MHDCRSPAHHRGTTEARTDHRSARPEHSGASPTSSMNRLAIQSSIESNRHVLFQPRHNVRGHLDVLRKRSATFETPHRRPREPGAFPDRGEPQQLQRKVRQFVDASVHHRSVIRGLTLLPDGRPLLNVHRANVARPPSAPKSWYPCCPFFGVTLPHWDERSGRCAELQTAQNGCCTAADRFTSRIHPDGPHHSDESRASFAWRGV